MAEFISGPTMIINWVGTGGTLLLSGDYRTFTWTPTVNYVDSSAGADTHITRLTALKDATASVGLTIQGGGTALLAALAAGAGGTLIVQPEGTATGKRKITFPCFSDGAVCEYPYAEVAVLTCGFTGNGAYTDGAN